ncbi:DUF5988 family protein [Amycolatopsis sp.]|uniref:DUF5988 family protein n=1 Tax=Amycolatopsis sp. TaxID=37632 RepID=UPI002D80D0B4|nr:DUF5988 family protein [Amycolatopsis sp.]HET6710669.1 DUF5988 family protein [Amycolatopsis sp.]
MTFVIARPGEAVGCSTAAPANVIRAIFSPPAGMFPAGQNLRHAEEMVMQKIVDGVSVTARLVGGPASIDGAARVREVDARESKIKLPHQGGYEHFERVAETPAGDRPVTEFHWTMRTKAAE